MFRNTDGCLPVFLGLSRLSKTMFILCKMLKGLRVSYGDIDGWCFHEIGDILQLWWMWHLYIYVSQLWWMFARNMFRPGDLPREHPHPSHKPPLQMGPGKTGSQSPFKPFAIKSFPRHFWRKPGAVHLTHFQLNHFEDKLTMHQGLRLDLKIILPVLLTSTFVIVSVAVVRNTYYEQKWEKNGTST